jgi:hypothetical protein
MRALAMIVLGLWLVWLAIAIHYILAGHPVP